MHMRRYGSRVLYQLSYLAATPDPSVSATLGMSATTHRTRCAIPRSYGTSGLKTLLSKPLSNPVDDDGACRGRVWR